MRRPLIALALLLAAFPAVAEGADVRVGDGFCKYGECSTRLAFEAADGERNDVRIRRGAEAGIVEVVDTGATLRPRAPGCMSVDPHTVECGDDDQIADVRVDLGDGSDRLDATGVVGHTRLTIRDGSGNDRVRSGAGPDTFLVGPGSNRLDGGGSSGNTLRFGRRSVHVRVDLAEGSVRIGGHAGVVRHFRDVRAGRADHAVVLGDRRPNLLTAGRSSLVDGRGGVDDVQALRGSVVRGGAGGDAVEVTAGGARAPARLECGAGRDVVSNVRIVDVVRADCERIGAQTGDGELQRLDPTPARGQPFARLAYSCLGSDDSEGCEVDVVVRLGSLRGPVLARQRIKHRTRRNLVVRQYGLRTTRRLARAAARRGGARVVVYYDERGVGDGTSHMGGLTTVLRAAR
jgi:hypothetical protein